MNSFKAQYGPWALVAGASEGLGAAFAEALAQRGLNLILVARREAKLKAFASQLTGQFGIDVVTRAEDLARTGVGSDLLTSLEHDIGLVISNAAYSAVGRFQDVELPDLQQVLAVNTATPLALAHTLVPRLVARGKGGLVLMSSLSGNQGSANIATYAASKAFNTVLAEGLWQELGAQGVDVIACCAGAIRTPGYQNAQVGDEAPGILDASVVAERTLNALGSGPVTVPGGLNKFADFLMRRLLPRSTAVRLMSNNTKELSG
ncbi:MAG: SDR family NAD(P)-dependent oxidoreductase [Luminiphilus sp.]|nr:SDR family NAD(P)-dependent oxidoreductase [Luminiphilus sp.]